MQKNRYSNGKKFTTHMCKDQRYADLSHYNLSFPSFFEAFWPLTSYARTVVQFFLQESLSVVPIFLQKSLPMWIRHATQATGGVVLRLRGHLPPVCLRVGDKDQATRESRAILMGEELFQVLLLRYLKNKLCFSTYILKNSNQTYMHFQKHTEFTFCRCSPQIDVGYFTCGQFGALMCIEKKNLTRIRTRKSPIWQP